MAGQNTSATMATNSTDHPRGSACTAEFGVATYLPANVGFLLSSWVQEDNYGWGGGGGGTNFNYMLVLLTLKNFDTENAMTEVTGAMTLRLVLKYQLYPSHASCTNGLDSLP